MLRWVPATSSPSRGPPGATRTSLTCSPTRTLYCSPPCASKYPLAPTPSPPALSRRRPHPRPPRPPPTPCSPPAAATARPGGGVAPAPSRAPAVWAILALGVLALVAAAFFPGGRAKDLVNRE